jgi:hypothetical protein
VIFRSGSGVWLTAVSRPPGDFCTWSSARPHPVEFRFRSYAGPVYARYHRNTPLGVLGGAAGGLLGVGCRRAAMAELTSKGLDGLATRRPGARDRGYTGAGRPDSAPKPLAPPSLMVHVTVITPDGRDGS